MDNYSEFKVIQEIMHRVDSGSLDEKIRMLKALEATVAYALVAIKEDKKKA